MLHLPTSQAAEHNAEPFPAAVRDRNLVFDGVLRSFAGGGPVRQLPF